jgi:hypothetical protein
VIRGTGQLVRPLAIAGALALAFWAGALSSPPVPDSAEPVVAAAPVEAFDPGPPSAPVSPQGVAAGPPAASTGPNLDRYCALSGRLDDVTTLYPDEPKVVLGQVAPQLDELARAAPPEIHGAVLIEIADVRAQGGGPPGPDVSARNLADTALTAFDDENC